MVRVTTNSDLFAGDGNIVAIVSLIRFFTSGRHQWILELETVSAVERFFGVNIPALSGSVGTLARKAWTSQVAWSSKSQVSQQSHSYAVSGATIEAALADLGRPGVLVVEDLISDGAFINAVTSAFGDSRITEALNMGWLELRHAGGGGRLLAISEDAAQKFQVQPRVGALIDSDSLYPGHRTRAHATFDHLVGLGLRCHVLAYREIENYIPNRALASIRPYPKSHKRLAALKVLDDAQRGHLDIKNGLGRRDKRFTRAPKEHQDLYSELDEHVLTALEEGFGVNIIASLTKISSVLTARDFASLGDSVRGEVEDLLSMIRELI